MTAQIFCFGWLPYLAILIFFVGSYFQHKSKAFRMAPEQLQNLKNVMSWEIFSLKWGFLVIFIGHVLAFLFPRTLLAFNGHPVRLILFEVTGLVFALCLLIGLALLFWRRMTSPHFKGLTNSIDMIMEILMLSQVVFGCWIALVYRWGSSWFASNLSPYLWSILKFHPHIDSVQTMPHVVQLHILTAYLMLILFPFTRFWPYLLIVIFSSSKNKS